MITTQQADFRNRIERIQAGSGCTRATVFVGQDTRFSYVPKNRRPSGAVGEIARNAGFVLAFPLCVLIGVLSHAIYLYADWLIAGLPRTAENIDLEMFKVALAGSAIAVLVSHPLGLREHALLLAKLAGVVLGMLFLHNLVHLYPVAFETVFSPLWVAKVTAMTEPHSMLFRGVCFAF
jgi:hypothetical protein